MKVHRYREAMNHIARAPDKLSKSDKAAILKDFYEPKSKPMNILKFTDSINHLYANGKPPKSDAHYDAVVAKAKQQGVKKDKKWKYESWSDGIEKLEKDKKAPVKVAGVKDSSLYKLLENPKLFGVEMGHETIMEIINLIQGSGLVTKPKKEPTKIAVVEKPKDPIDHIAILESLRKT